jgi:hypothetical protein
MINMNEYIAEQIDRGVSLSDMVKELEKVYHNENVKKQKQEKHIAEINASLERAAAATADYFNTITESTEFDAEMFKEMLTELANSAQVFAKAKTKAKEVKNAAAQTRGVMNPSVEIVHNRVEDKDAEDTLMQFLFDMGLIKHVD